MRRERNPKRLKLGHYIDGQKFSIETDNNRLVFLKKNAGDNPRLLRWAKILQLYHYDINHRPDKDIPQVDYLSRVARFYHETELPVNIKFHFVLYK